MTMPRGVTLAGRLATLGFADTARAQDLLADDLGLDAFGHDAEVVSALAAAPDPDLALAGLAAMAPDAELLARLRGDHTLRKALTSVLGMSSALADHLRRHRGDWRLLGAPDADSVPAPAELAAGLEAVTDPGHLRIAYRRALLRLAAADLAGALPIDDVMAALADLAAAALKAALAIARS